MFENIAEAIEYIESKRSRHTIEEFKSIVCQLGLNLKQKNMIHVCGTNGKGSTVNYMSEILMAHGYRVAIFTSPYLENHNDRFRVDGKPISDDNLLKYINKYRLAIEEYNLSMFEIDTIIMLDYFNNETINYRIIECGIGGSRDKTNVIEPILSIITNVGLDHQNLLGDTLEDIAMDKAGVIKKNAQFITGEQNGDVLNIFQKKCDQQGVIMHFVPEQHVSSYPFKVKFQNISIVIKDQGHYQVSNVRLALFALNLIMKLDLNKCKSAVENAKWEGRFEVIPYDKYKIYIDGAHNLPGIEALIKTLEIYKISRPIVIFSSLKDKKFDEMIDLLYEHGCEIVLTSFGDERVMDLSVYKKDKRLIVSQSFDEALKYALIQEKEIVITGSLHFVSYVRKYLLK